MNWTIREVIWRRGSYNWFKIRLDRFQAFMEQTVELEESTMYIDTEVEVE